MSAAQPSPSPARELPFPLQDGERILDLCRRHWLYLYPRLIALLAVAVAPVALAAWGLSKADALDGALAKVFWAIAGLWLAYWGIRLLFTWYRYNNDIWVITNQRIVDSLKTTPFNLRLSTADLINIQDMTVERKGVLPTLFDFGDMICQTAAEMQEFRLAGIPHPREVQALVDRERDRERLRSSGTV